MTQVRALASSDRRWVESACAREFGAARMAVRGRLMNPAEHEGFVALRDGAPAGFITYLIEDRQCEITAIVAEPRWLGTGSLLLQATLDRAKAEGCRRLWLITTNDNLPALRFYQRRGFSIAYVHRGAVDISRRNLKPEIPATGDSGIPLRDELELEIRLAGDAPFTGGIFAPERLRFGIGVGGIVTRGESVLLVHHLLDGDHDFWVMPGGGLDDREGLKDAVRREVFEETGLRVTVGRAAYIEDFREEHGRSMKLWFACEENAPREPTHRGNPALRETIVEARFLHRSELANLTVYPGIVKRDEFWTDVAMGFPAARVLEVKSASRTDPGRRP